MNKILPFLAVVALAACTRPVPPPVEKEETAAEWKKRACIGEGTPCAEKPEGIPQVHSKARLDAAPRFVAGPEIEGWGNNTTGGSNLCIVTNSAATGAGSFSSCARQSNVNVVFNGPGPFTVDSQQTYIGSNITIDGCANGQTGVILNQPSDRYRAVVSEGKSNLVFRCLTFKGEGKPNSSAVEHDLLALDGTDGSISNVIVDRCTFTGASDGALDITGNTSNVTVQRSLFHQNALTMLVKYGNRAKISMHHNVLNSNCERNPQIKGALDGFVWVNNVSGKEANPQIIDGGNGLPFKDCYGMRCWVGSDSPGNPLGNIINSLFFGQSPWTLTGVPGVYANGNLCNGANCGPSPASQPYPVPAEFAITTQPTSGLSAMLATVGNPLRSAADQAAIDRVAALLGGVPATPTPTASPTTSPTPSPTVSPTTSPTPTPCAECPAGTSCRPACQTPTPFPVKTCNLSLTTTPGGELRVTVTPGTCTFVQQ